AEPQRTALAFGQHNRAALGVEGADGVVENRVQQLFFVFEVNEMMAGAQQGQELLARPRTAVAVEGDALQRVLPGIGGGRFDEQSFGSVADVLIAGIGDDIDDEANVAAAADVVHAQRPFAGAEARAVEEGAVGAAEVTDAPAVGGGADFRVPPADGAVIEHDFERGEAAGAEQTVRFPDLTFNFAAYAAQAYLPPHASLLSTANAASVRGEERGNTKNTIACNSTTCRGRNSWTGRFTAHDKRSDFHSIFLFARGGNFY